MDIPLLVATPSMFVDHPLGPLPGHFALCTSTFCYNRILNFNEPRLGGLESSKPHGFSGAEPGESEKELHAEVAKILSRSEEILERLFNYKGCEEFIRKVPTFASCYPHRRPKSVVNTEFALDLRKQTQFPSGNCNSCPYPYPTPGNHYTRSRIGAGSVGRHSPRGLSITRVL